MEVGGYEGLTTSFPSADSILGDVTPWNDAVSSNGNGRGGYGDPTPLQLNASALGDPGSSDDDVSRDAADNPRNIWEQYKSSRGLGSLGGSAASTWGPMDDGDAGGGSGAGNGSGLTRKGGRMLSRAGGSAASWLV